MLTNPEPHGCCHILALYRVAWHRPAVVNLLDFGHCSQHLLNGLVLHEVQPLGPSQGQPHTLHSIGPPQAVQLPAAAEAHLFTCTLQRKDDLHRAAPGTFFCGCTQPGT